MDVRKYGFVNQFYKESKGEFLLSFFLLIFLKGCICNYCIYNKRKKMTYELEKSLGFRINRTANKINNKYNKILQEYDIAPEQRATLEIIKYEKDVNQTKIAEILGKDKTTISRTLSSLEKKDFITKVQSDKRTNQIKLTSKAEEMLEKSASIVKDFREKLKTNLDETEIKTLVELLEKVTLGIKE